MAHSGWLSHAMSMLVLAAGIGPAVAGPPYQSDDPEPTDFGHFEIYSFDKGAFGRSGSSSASGLDFNYGAAPDLQLTAVVPFGYDAPSDGPSAFGPGNVELAAKYKLIHQDTLGLDVSVFPRVFLPSPSQTGDPYASILVPTGFRKTGARPRPLAAAAASFRFTTLPKISASTAPPLPVRSSTTFSWVSRCFIRHRMEMVLRLRLRWESARDMISTTTTTCWAMSRAAWKTSLRPEVGRGMHRFCSPISKVRRELALRDFRSRSAFHTSAILPPGARATRRLPPDKSHPNPV